MQTKLDGGIKIFQSHTQIERKTAEWFDCLTKKTGETNRKKDAEREKKIINLVAIIRFDIIISDVPMHDIFISQS